MSNTPTHRLYEMLMRKKNEPMTDTECFELHWTDETINDLEFVEQHDIDDLIDSLIYLQSNWKRDILGRELRFRLNAIKKMTENRIEYSK